MRRPLASVVALAFVATVVAVFAGTPEAQTGTGTLETCASGGQEIDARALPRTVSPARCPLEGRKIIDGIVGAAVPAPGEGVHAEVLTTEGAQEFEVRRLGDGTVELGHVGKEEPDLRDAAALDSAGKSPGECGDSAFNVESRRVRGTLAYRINWRTTPGYLSRRAAISAIRQAGGNVADTVNACKMGDRVPAGIAYKGYTARTAGVGFGACETNDGVSVVSFGPLKNPGYLAATCTHTREEFGYEVVTSSDTRINKRDRRWTTNPRSRSCRGRFDLEGVMTHERGHTFGLGHVDERAHRNLTMGPIINGPCQSSERSLGRGDVRGLDRKYP